MNLTNPLICEPECLKVPTETLKEWENHLTKLCHPKVTFCEDFDLMRDEAAGIQMRGIDSIRNEIRKTLNNATKP